MRLSRYFLPVLKEKYPEVVVNKSGSAEAEEDFIRELFTRGETQLGRAFVQEPSLSEENALHVLDYERASEVIETTSHIGVGRCYCRHKMEHMGKACSAPQDICMTFNTTASSLTRHGVAREIDKEECHDLLQEAYDNNLVQFGENNGYDMGELGETKDSFGHTQFSASKLTVA